MMAKGILLDIGKLMPVLDAFTDLTNIRVGYFSANGSQIIGQMRPVSSFCQRIKSTEVGSGRCIQCDRQAVQHVRNQALDCYLYRCHMEISEAVTPLYIEQQYVGYLMLGQVHGETPSLQQWEQVKGKIMELGLDPEELRPLYYRLPIVTRRQLEAACRLLVTMASHLVVTKTVQLVQEGRIEAIKSYIQTNLHRPLTLSELAALVGLSPTHTSTLFSRETGESLSTYIRTERLHRAEKLLRETDLTIKEVASRVGYDPEYFSKVFRQYHKESPREYRSRYRKSAEGSIG